MSDLISRQAAISVIAKWMLEYGGEGEERERNALKQAAEGIKDLPSAQPEIIRCKECKYWREYKYVNGKPKYLPYCGFNDIYFREDDYCSHAERRGR